MSAQVEFALSSHPGLVRADNEDAVGVDPDLGLAVLADGLGGHNAGEVASSMAVSRLLALARSDWMAAVDANAVPDIEVILSRRLAEINDAIVATAQVATNAGMATTIVLAWRVADQWWICHAGDSRAYRFGNGTLLPLTRDHSYMQELVDAGVVASGEMRHLPGKNLITRALGVSRQVEADISQVEVPLPDWLLLCSDGLHGMLSDADIAAELAAALPDACRAAQRLVDRANAAGGQDNCSVILLRARA
jgi:PPM family protein phosphatase